MKQSELKRSSGLGRTGGPKRKNGFAASPRQRAKVAGEEQCCVHCGCPAWEGFKLDPAHLIPRGMGGCDSADCVVPLCRECHRAYDDGHLDLLPHLEGPNGRRRELAHAVGHVGLVCALERITNERWRPHDG